MADEGRRVIDRRLLSPENGLIAAVMAMRYGGGPPVPDPRIDWTAFVARVRQHRIALWIDTAALRAAAMPAPAALKLMRLHAAERQRWDLFEAETLRLAEAFAGAGIDLLVLKGAGLSALLYGGRCLRVARDIDLLVRPEDAPAALALLRGLGYDDRAAGTVRHHNAVEIRHADTAMPVELHVRFDDAEALFPTARARPFETAIEVAVRAGRLRTLGRELAIVYAAYHGTKHFWRRLFWLGDIAEAMRAPDVDWREAFAMARRIGVDRHLALALVLARGLLDAAMPPAAAPAMALLQSGAERDAWTMRAVLAVPDFLDEPALRRRMGRFAYARWTIGLLRNWRARAAQLGLWLGV